MYVPEEISSSLQQYVVAAVSPKCFFLLQIAPETRTSFLEFQARTLQQKVILMLVYRSWQEVCRNFVFRQRFKEQHYGFTNW